MSEIQVGDTVEIKTIAGISALVMDWSSVNAGVLDGRVGTVIEIGEDFRGVTRYRVAFRNGSLADVESHQLEKLENL